MSEVTTNMKARNGKVLADFIVYCHEHPDERFWQALRNWSGYNFIYAKDGQPISNDEIPMLLDTFNFEGRDK